MSVAINKASVSLFGKGCNGWGCLAVDMHTRFNVEWPLLCETRSNLRWPLSVGRTLFGLVTHALLSSRHAVKAQAL